jgi:excinuclease ABC subunit A
LDEPTIGLHQRDNAKLIQTLKDLRDLGNSVVVVEHDEDTILASDYLVDIGPGAGVHGGEIVAAGEMPKLLKDKTQNSSTLQYLRGAITVHDVTERRSVTKNHDVLKLKGVSTNNLKNLDVSIPLRRFVAVTGVSGSGKSSLVYDVLYKTLSNTLNRTDYKIDGLKSSVGVEYVNRVINIDQAAIGRTPRSNPATYVGAWTR